MRTSPMVRPVYTSAYSAPVTWRRWSQRGDLLPPSIRVGGVAAEHLILYAPLRVATPLLGANPSHFRFSKRETKGYYGWSDQACRCTRLTCYADVSFCGC
jgi:hypothetical protein